MPQAYAANRLVPLVPRASGPAYLVPRSLRRQLIARALWGSALLMAPGAILAKLPNQGVDRPARVSARVLGARDLLQAAFAVRHHTRRWILAGAAVDASHAATMVLLAWLAPGRRKLALANAAAATALAAAGILESRRIQEHACACR